MGADARDSNPRTLNVDSVGVDELGVVPWPILLRRWLGRRVPIGRHWAVLVVVLSALFTVGFTITILAVSLGSIAGDLDSSISVVSWSITGPMLAFGVVGPAYGKAGDLWGHKRVFVCGLLGAGVFAALTSVAWDAPSMIAFRILSASAGAATGPSTMAYINRLFPADQRVRPLSYWSFVNAGAPVLGVIAGAPLVEAFGWRIIFAVQAPLCIVGVVIAVWLLPDTERSAEVHFDVAGSVALGLGATMLLAGVNQGPKWGWDSLLTVGLLCASIASLALFVRIEKRARDPLLPLRWLRTRNVAYPVLSQTLANFAYMGGFLLAPLVLSEVMQFDNSKISFVVIARPLTFALVAPLASLVTIRVGERAMGVVGGFCVVMSMFLFAAIDIESPLMVVLVALGLSGAGIGIASPAMTSLVANAVDERDLGVAGAMQQLMTQMGAVFGSVVMTTVQQASSGDDSSASSFVAAFYVATGAAAVAMILSTRVTSTPRGDAITR
ncbi:MAG: MFS transporter [Actinobacteria bacterium]|nr:MFS transporter [Actinomycetota bacterium]